MPAPAIPRTARHRTPLSRAEIFWRDTRRWLASLSVIAIGAGGLGLAAPATAAHADDIADAIGNVRTTTTDAVAGQSFRLDFDWAVPDESPAGTTFTLALPPELVNANTVTIKLPAPDGALVAAGVWSGRTATFTLTDYVTTHPYSISGTGWFLARLDTDTIGSGETTITTTVAGTSITIRQVVPDNGGGDDGEDPGPRPPEERDAYKWAWWTRDDQGTVDPSEAITWVLNPPVYSTVTERMVVVDDVPAGAGWEFACESPWLQHYRGNPNLDWAGNFDLDNPVLPGTPFVTDFTCSPTRLSVTFEKVPAYDYFEIVIRADVIDSNRSSFANTFSTTTSDGRTAGDSTRVSLDAGGDGSGIPGSQLRLRKFLAGPVPTTAPELYTIVATCVAPGSGTPTVHSREVRGDGATWVAISPLEPGTECTISEPESHGAVMTADALTVTIVAEEPSDVTVTNTFPELPVVPEEPDSPEAPELPTLPLDDPTDRTSLALTGATGDATLAGAVAVAVGGLLLLLLGTTWRRRTRE